MNRYAMELTKSGYMKYISHLDMMRLFKCAFKKAGIMLAYSQGFNPHPKMSFAQPLSLGYSSSCETIEFDTGLDLDTASVTEKMNGILPEGIRILSCEKAAPEKSLAARTFAAAYEIAIPAERCIGFDMEDTCKSYLEQGKILAVKFQKKTMKKSEIDIKGMVKELTCASFGDETVLYAALDTGSVSNLSPELLISSFLSFSGIDCPREEIEVNRVKLFFK